MDSILDQLNEAAAEVDYEQPRIPIVSNLTGQRGELSTFAEPAYWSQHARQPVLFHQGMQVLSEMGCSAFLEIGPQPILIGMGRRCVASSSDMCWLSSLRKGKDDWQTMLDSLAQLFVAGVNVDWQAFDSSWPRRRCSLPTYPFQRKRYWVEADPSHLKQQVRRTSSDDSHPLLG